jgi:hypothetical protein
VPEPLTPEPAGVPCAQCGQALTHLLQGPGQAWCEVCAGTWSAWRRSRLGVPGPSPARDRVRRAIRELEEALEAAQAPAEEGVDSVEPQGDSA